MVKNEISVNVLNYKRIVQFWFIVGKIILNIFDCVRVVRLKVFPKDIPETPTVAISVDDPQSNCLLQLDRNRLQYWKLLPLQRTNVPYIYPRKVVHPIIALMAYYAAIADYGSKRILQFDKNERNVLLNGLRPRLTFFRQEASSVPVLAESFPHVLQFLYDMEMSDDEDLWNMLEHIFRERISQPSFWFVQFSHCRLIKSTCHQKSYEASTSLVALSYRDGLSFNEKVEMRMRNSLYRSIMDCLIILSYAIIEKCIDLEPSAECLESSLERKKSANVENLLHAAINRSFMRFYPPGLSQDTQWYYDCLSYEIALNCCNDIIPSDWSAHQMERSIWLFEKGKHFVSKWAYDVLRKSSGKPCLDLTMFKASTLLSFSISGLINFHGRNESLYKLAGDERANIQLFGYLPKVSVQDLVDLKIISKIKEGYFEVLQFPACKDKFCIVPVGDQLLLSKSKTSKPFRASLAQKFT